MCEAIKQRIKVIKNESYCHIVNGVPESRLSSLEFDYLRRYLRENFSNKLNRDLYDNQPVYEYLSTTDELMNKIHQYNNNINIDTGEYTNESRVLD